MFRISSSRTISAISSPSFRSASFAASSRAFSARSLVRTAINSETSAAMTSVYGMANGTERQLLIVDADGQTYTSGMTLLEQEQAAAVIEAVLSGAAESGPKGYIIKERGHPEKHRRERRLRHRRTESGESGWR